MTAPRVRSFLATDSILGQFGLGGPAARLAAVLARDFGPAAVFARGESGAGLPPGTVRLHRKAPWRRLLHGTRLHRLQMRPEARERIGFDRAAARVLPPCDLAVVENSTGLGTLRRAKAAGARTLLLYYNREFRGFRADLEEERRRWGGPAPFITQALVERCEAEAAEADLVTAFSGAVLDGLERTGVPRSRLRRAHYAVDAERFRPAPRRDGEFTVALVGWLAFWKGYPYLVEAFRDARIPGSRLLLHGGTDVRYHHGLVARLKGDADVSVVRGPVEETYARASVVVLPSVSDAYGIAALEGMACGLPVIVSDRCGAAEDVREGENGFVVPARDTGALRDRLVRLHADPALRARMGEAARRTALTRPWDLFERDFVAILREAIGS